MLLPGHPDWPGPCAGVFPSGQQPHLVVAQVPAELWKAEVCMLLLLLNAATRRNIDHCKHTKLLGNVLRAVKQL